MTTLKYTYRPFSSSLTLWNDDLGSECDDIENVHIDAPENGDWHIRFSTMTIGDKQYFHSMTALDAFECGAGWNLYLSKYLPDEVIDSIYQNVYAWESHPMADDIMEKVKTVYAESLEINGDCAVS